MGSHGTCAFRKNIINRGNSWRAILSTNVVKWWQKPFYLTVTFIFKNHFTQSKLVFLHFIFYTVLTFYNLLTIIILPKLIFFIS